MPKSKRARYSGARQVNREELDQVEAPAATATWFPVQHSVVFDAVSSALGEAGFVVKRVQFWLYRKNGRMFAAVDLTNELAPGATLSIAVRNSIDRSLPLGCSAGNRAVVSDNLAFLCDILVAKKHTLNGRARFEGEITRAVRTLSAFHKHERERVLALQQRMIADETAEAIMLRAFEKRHVSARTLPLVISQWREPSHEEFKPRSAWSLLNAFTTAISSRAKSNPQEYSRTTMRLGGLIDAALGLRAFALPAHVPEIDAPDSPA